MVAVAEEMKVQHTAQNESSSPVFKIKKDSRIIPWLATFLRKTNLDELPHLFNVLKGEMRLNIKTVITFPLVEKYQRNESRIKLVIIQFVVYSRFGDHNSSLI